MRLMKPRLLLAATRTQWMLTPLSMVSLVDGDADTEDAHTSPRHLRARLVWGLQLKGLQIRDAIALKDALLFYPLRDVV